MTKSSIYGNIMMHFILDWFDQNWQIPIQFHTGLGRMYDGDSDAAAQIAGSAADRGAFAEHCQLQGLGGSHV